MDNGKRPVVFCVDDDPDLLAWMDLALSDQGFEIQTESDAVKALGRIRTVLPDVLLLDVTMPGMDGYQLCEKLQSSADTSYIPVIFVTGLAGEWERSRAFTVGAVDYLVKPIAEEAVLRAVRDHLGTRRKFSDVKKISGSTPPRETSARSEGAPRWDAALQSSGFARFKDFLAGRLALPAEKAKGVARLTTGSVYSGTSELGIPARKVAEAISAFLSFPLAPRIEPSQVRLGVLPTPFCLTNQVLAVGGEGGTTGFVVSNPFNWEALEAIRRVGEASPRISIAEPAAFEPLRGGGARPAPAPAPGASAGSKTPSIEQIRAELHLELGGDAAPAEGAPAEAVDDAGPLIELVNHLIETAYESGASDIHIEPTETEVIVRYRIDGDLHVVDRLNPKEVSRRVIARLKVMSGLDLAEHRLPQDGRIRFKPFSRKGSDFDLRLAVIPVNHGEKACMRILDKQKSVLPLEKLGFSARNLSVYRQKIRAPYGMILHVGPTGSGKSMSLYAALNEVKDATVNIQTAEDPIEYTLPDINQLQVHPDIGLTFSRALRSFLRMDPDVILVGEIRDPETAKIAIEASLTGHLLLSTLHTNDSASTVTRFIEMGIEPYLVSSSLLLVCAQRLLRRLCPDCREAYAPEAEERRIVGAGGGESLTLYRPRGCARCMNTGYRGRIAVHEIFVPNDALRQAMNRRGVSSEELKRMAVEDCGMTSLYWDAMDKVRQGICSIPDALQNVRRDEFDGRPPWAARAAGLAAVGAGSAS